MYKTLSADTFRTHLDLGLGYEVEGFLVYGGWKREIYDEVLGLVGELGRPFSSARFRNEYLAPILEITLDGKCFWFVVSYGGALLSEFAHLACLLGSRKNLVIGSCGGLYSDALAGDLIIPTYSYADESSARGYRETDDHQHWFDASLRQQLRARFNPDLRIWEGPTVTHQAMLSETWEDVRRWLGQGYYGVEMEAGTVAAVSNHFGVQCACALRITDNLIRQETIFNPAYQDHRPARRLRRADMLRIALIDLLGI